MAENEELEAFVTERIDRAEGFIADAEFRDDLETRQIRYFQAMSEILLVVVIHMALAAAAWAGPSSTSASSM